MKATAMTPEGSGLTVQEAAGQFLQMMDPEDAPEDTGPAPDEVPPVEEDAETPAADDPPQEPAPYRLKVGGEEREVTLDEMVSLAQQGADYTKKTQALAEQRRELSARAAELDQARTARDAYAQRLQAVEELLASTPEEDLDALRANDPAAYAVKVADQTRRHQQMALIAAERNRIATEQQAEYARAAEAAMTLEAQTLAHDWPEYADPDKGDAAKAKLRDYARGMGYSDTEIGMVQRARDVQVLRKAMLYDELQKAKPEVAKRVAEAPRTLKVGTHTPTAASEQARRDATALKNSGRVRDAARYFEHLI